MDGTDRTSDNRIDETADAMPLGATGGPEDGATAPDDSPCAQAAPADARLTALVLQARAWDTAEPIACPDPVPWATTADRLRRVWRRVRHVTWRCARTRTSRRRYAQPM